MKGLVERKCAQPVTSDGAHLLGGERDEADDHEQHEDLLHGCDPNPSCGGCLQANAAAPRAPGKLGLYGRSMKLANVNGRAALVLADGIADIAGAQTVGSTPTPWPSSTAGESIAQRAVRRHRDRRRPHRSGGRARRGHRQAGRPCGRSGCVERRRRPHCRAGRQRSCTAVRRRRAVLSSASRGAASDRWVRGSSRSHELADPDDLGLGCSVDGETMQKTRAPTTSSSACRA